MSGELSLSSKHAFLQHLQKVVSIAIVLHGSGNPFHLLRADVALAISNLLGARDHQALASLDGLNEKRGLKHRLVGSCIEPCHSAAHYSHVEHSAFQILAVNVGDFEFPAWRGLKVFRDLNHLRVVEVEPGDCVPRLGYLRLLFQAERLALPVELNYTVAFRIVHGVGKDASSTFTLRGGLHRLDKVMPVEDVVAQNQRAATGVDELFTDQERLRNAFWFRLRGVGECQAKTGTVAEKMLEFRQVLGR